jgi:hypothetical protein
MPEADIEGYTAYFERQSGAMGAAFRKTPFDVKTPNNDLPGFLYFGA